MCNHFFPVVFCFFLGQHCNTFVCWQEDDNYEQSSDVRAQLKFFEQLDQLEKQRKEEQEREILLKAAKVLTDIKIVYLKATGDIVIVLKGNVVALC